MDLYKQLFYFLIKLDGRFLNFVFWHFVLRHEYM